MKTDGWRFIQTHAVNGEQGIDLYYSFMKNGHVVNYRIAGVTKDDVVPSITDMFLAAFVFENEARELFGVDMRDIAIDFQGGMYAPAEYEPMTFISPEQKAAKEKAAKAAAAKAAKEATGAATNDEDTGQGGASQRRVFVLTPERKARLEAKMATMSPEKVAKVKAALKAREAEAAQAAASANATASDDKKDVEDKTAVVSSADTKPIEAAFEKTDKALEEKIAELPIEKAAKVRAAIYGTAGGADASKADEPKDVHDSFAADGNDAQLVRLLGMMDEDKAAIVRAALAQKGGN
jgi:hypothetical protein